MWVTCCEDVFDAGLLPAEDGRCVVFWPPENALVCKHCGSRPLQCGRSSGPVVVGWRQTDTEAA